MTVKSKVLVIFIVLTTNWIVEENVVKAEKDNHSADKNITGAPVSVNSRFGFGLGQILGSMFPNINQNRPGGNFGSNLPQNQNPQFQPFPQSNLPQGPNPENTWGNQNQGNFNPPQNQGFNPQGRNGPNQWQNPQFSNPDGIQNPNYPGNINNFPQSPNQQMPNAPNQWQNPQTQGGMQNPTYPNDPDYQNPGNNQNSPSWRPEYTNQGPNQNSPSWRPEYTNQGPNQNSPSWRPEYTNQGPNQFQNQGGSNSQFQPTDQEQQWGQQRPIPNPDQNRPIQFPDQDYQRPDNEFNNYPSNNNQAGQDPIQGWQSNNGGGTLDDMFTQTGNSSGNNAILGKPVIVPTTTVNPDEIFFNNTTESPLQRQCVQDCPATPEYNPICGTNNVTYFNPGKFVCARNCGVSVYVARRGVCRRRPM